MKNENDRKNITTSISKLEIEKLAVANNYIPSKVRYYVWS